jgi:hypothetical protein
MQDRVRVITITVQAMLRGPGQRDDAAVPLGPGRAFPSTTTLREVITWAATALEEMMPADDAARGRRLYSFVDDDGRINLTQTIEAYMARRRLAGDTLALTLQWNVSGRN